MRKLSMLFTLAILMVFLPVYSEAEVLSKIKVIAKDGKVSYYDNFGNLIEDNVIFKEYKKSPGVYYPTMKNPYDTREDEKIWVEFDVLPRLMDGGSFGKGSSWFLSNIYVPMQYVYQMEPFKLRFAVEVENDEPALISIHDIRAEIGRSEKMFLKFFDAINNRTPLRVAGWLYTARFILASTKQELYRGYLKENLIAFEPFYAVPLWWKKESADMAGDRNRPNIQAP